MASPAAPDAITEDEINLLKLMKMAHGIARSVLYTVFLWGTKQKPGESVEDYLRITKKCSNKDYKGWFDNHQRTRMSDKTLEDTFDVTLLCRVIKHTCDKLDESCQFCPTQNDKLGSLVKAVKDFRNDCSHGFKGISKELLSLRANKLMDLLRKTLTVAGILYGKDAKGEIGTMEEDIKSVRDQNLITSDISYYQVVCQNARWKDVLKKGGAEELRERYEGLSQINPVSFLEGERMLLDVSMVFTQIEVENAGQKKKGLQVPCQEILTFCRNNATAKPGTKISSPEVYLIEGPGGSGKTTLMKYMKAVWLNKRDCILLGLDEFDLLLYMECRNPSLSSFSELLCQLMPNTNATYFREGELLKFTLNLKTLILVDGLDELNSSSEKLFKDIINQNNNLVVFCTSRPEKVRHFKVHVPPTCHTAHLKLTGIADSKREEFIRKYHGEMQKHCRSKQDTEPLISFIKRSESRLRNHYRLPINLVLLTWLWAEDPGSVTPVTTSSELYIQIHNLMKKKLMDRLAHHEDASRIDLQDLEQKLKTVMCSVYKAALDSLRKDAIESLLPECVDQMEVTCKANNLPFRETMSAFFVIRTVEREEQISVPHKLLHDFYAAQCVVQNLFNENQESENRALLQRLAVFVVNQPDFDPVTRQKVLSMSVTEMEQTTTAPKPVSLKALFEDLSLESKQINKYQSMLLHVAGIVYALHGSQVQEQIGKEIVELLKHSGLGIRDDNDWFNLFELTKNDSDVIRHASKYISRRIEVNDERVEAALRLLLTGRPKEITLDITRKAQSTPDLQSLLKRIANCGSQLELLFRGDFWNPGPLPSNDDELRIISQSLSRCRIMRMACHVSGSILAEIGGALTGAFLDLAVASDEAAQELMINLTNRNPDFKPRGLALHLTKDVSPKALRTVEGIRFLSLFVSEVQDSDLDRVLEMAKAILPQNERLEELRFPRSPLTSAGCKSLLENMKKAGVSAGYLYIPEEVVLQQDEQKLLKDFADKELGCDFCRLPVNPLHPAAYRSAADPSTSIKLPVNPLHPAAYRSAADPSTSIKLTQRNRDLLQRGLMFAVHTTEGRSRQASISLEDDRLYLHCLRDQPLPRGAVTLQVDEVTAAAPPCQVFLILEWPGSAPRRVLIRLSPDTPMARQFLLLCTGQRGPCYKGTKLFDVWRKGRPGEYVRGGDYELNNGDGGAALLPDIDKGVYVSVKAGDVGGWWGGDPARGAQFSIITKDRRKSVVPSVIGKVEVGLEVVQEAARHSPITEITVVDCGVVVD